MLFIDEIQLINSSLDLWIFALLTDELSRKYFIAHPKIKMWLHIFEQ